MYKVCISSSKNILLLASAHKSQLIDHQRTHTNKKLLIRVSLLRTQASAASVPSLFAGYDVHYLTHESMRHRTQTNGKAISLSKER